MSKKVTKISNITQHDSDIVTPYGKWAYYNATIRFTVHIVYITRALQYKKEFIFNVLFKRRQEQQEDKSEGKTKDALMKVPHQSCKAYS